MPHSLSLTQTLSTLLRFGALDKMHWMVHEIGAEFFKNEKKLL